MRAEPSCFGFTTPRTDGLFFALFPDAAAAARLATVAAQQCIRHRLGGRPIRAARFHVSLIGFGAHAGVPADLLAALKAAAASVALPSFDATFDRAMSFQGRPHPRVLCGDNAELIAFQRSLAAALAREGLGGVKPQFLPHVTLLYDERSLAEDAIEPIRWTVAEFVLVRSRRGEGRYELLARWPLRVAPAAAVEEGRYELNEPTHEIAGCAPGDRNVVGGERVAQGGPDRDRGGERGLRRKDHEIADRRRGVKRVARAR